MYESRLDMLDLAVAKMAAENILLKTLLVRTIAHVASVSGGEAELRGMSDEIATACATARQRVGDGEQQTLVLEWIRAAGDGIISNACARLHENRN